ncbi:hypothetical protein LUD75_03400 [Epilithonimonas sp. JDS]|uniref:hypothetical protein n=1 Tax=Epilithonimonas sp. JDS TaxID=2902797 RepID=UPI001E5586CB|nr:hypothetical protein [Epilithonimonas sp. JDS]MCD9853732.1 hypothetical protein [Epilithonimonas sp. JDS]
METEQIQTTNKKTRSKTDYSSYIDNLPYEAFIMQVSAINKTKASGEGIINKGGEISFKVSCEVDLCYTEKDEKYGFSISGSTTNLLQILNPAGASIPFSKKEELVITNFLNDKILF